MIIVRIGTKRGDVASRYVREIKLEDLQALVGGYIEPAAPVELREQGIELLVNEEGLLKGLDTNENLFPFFFVGQAVAVGVGGEDFVSLSQAQVNFLEDWLRGLENT